MKTTILTMPGVLTLMLSADRSRALAQHHGGRPAAGHPQAQPHNNGMAHQVPPHIQQQMIAEQRKYEQQMAAAYARQQQAAQKQYEGQANQFRDWLKANGGSAFQGNNVNLPKTPAEFDQWAATQRKLKARGKSYDPLYDQFRSFSGASNASNTGGRQHESA